MEVLVLNWGSLFALYHVPGVRSRYCFKPAHLKEIVAAAKRSAGAVQKQIEVSKRRAAAHAADLQTARAEIAELKLAAAQSQREARQAAASGPHVRKLEAEAAALRERLREAQAARGAEADARQQADREAGQLEETAEEAGVQLRRVQVCRQHVCAAWESDRHGWSHPGDDMVGNNTDRGSGSGDRHAGCERAQHARRCTA